jgi:hypothetical protein
MKVIFFFIVLEKYHIQVRNGENATAQTKEIPRQIRTECIIIGLPKKFYTFIICVLYV